MRIALTIGTWFGVMCAVSAHGEVKTDGPFRTRLLKMNTELDEAKPIGTSYLAGWSLTNGALIGQSRLGYIESYSLKKGRSVWWTPVTSDLSAPILPVGNSVIAGLRNGKLMKLDGQTGQKLWETDLGSFATRPMVTAGPLVIVVTAAQLVYGVDLETGKTTWLFDGGFPEGLTIQNAAPPVVSDSKVLVGLASGELVALDLRTGQEVARNVPGFSTSRFRDHVGEIVLLGDSIITTRYDGTIVRLKQEADKFETVWEQTLPDISTSTYRDGWLYVSTVSGDIYAVDTKQGGAKAWRTQTGQAATSIIVGQKNALVVGTNGRVTNIDRLSGDIRWHDNLAGTVASSPIVTQKEVLIPTGLKVLYGFAF